MKQNILFTCTIMEICLINDLGHESIFVTEPIVFYGMNCNYGMPFRHCIVPVEILSIWKPFRFLYKSCMPSMQSSEVHFHRSLDKVCKNPKKKNKNEIVIRSTFGCRFDCHGYGWASSLLLGTTNQETKVRLTYFILQFYYSKIKYIFIYINII